MRFHIPEATRSDCFSGNVLRPENRLSHARGERPILLHPRGLQRQEPIVPVEKWTSRTLHGTSRPRQREALRLQLLHQEVRDERTEKQTRKGVIKSPTPSFW